MNTRSIRGCELGLITNQGKGKSPINSLLVSENIRWHKGEAYPREGQHYLDSDIVFPDDIDAIFEYTREYWDANNNEVAFHREYVVAIGGSLYSWEGPDDDTIYLINPDDTLSSGDIYVAIFNDWAYIANGIDRLYRYDAASFRYACLDAPSSAWTVNATTDEAHRNNSLAGIRRYKVRYARKTDFTSAGYTEYFASPFSDWFISGDFNFQQRRITLIASDDEQVNTIQIFGTKLFENESDIDDTTEYYLLAEEDNEDGYWYDNITNTMIEQPEGYGINPGEIYDNVSGMLYPEEDITEDWTHAPVGLKYLMFFKERLYGVDVKDDPSVVSYCEIGQPASWPLTNKLDVKKDDGDVITGFAAAGNTLYIFKNRSIYAMTGDPEAVPMVEIKAGADSTMNQSEFGLGCTAPRSIASYGEGAIIFYSKIHGVWMIADNTLVNLSKNVSGITGLSDSCAGAVYTDDNENAYYVLSPPTGNAWIFHLQTRTVGNDTGVNCGCFIVDHNGYLLGGDGAYINRFYHPDYTDDNGSQIKCRMQTAWVNLRDSLIKAVVRGLFVNRRSFTDSLTVTIENEDGISDVAVLQRDSNSVGIDDISGRLFSVTLDWLYGIVESMVLVFKPRRMR